VQGKVDVLISSSFLRFERPKTLPKTIPLVMVTTLDPVATGLINSLAGPGGISPLSRLSRLTSELNEKRLELLKEVLRHCRASECSCHRRRLAESCRKEPDAFDSRRNDFVEAGALVSYSAQRS
jgi:hypothetical protein